MRGYYRKLTAQNVNAGKVMRCVQLLDTDIHDVAVKEKANSTTITEEDLSLPFVIKAKSNNPRMRLLQDATLEYQILEVLRAAGTSGATQKEIGYALNCDESRILYKVLDKMCSWDGPGIQNYAVRRSLEFNGRQRRYRYYTYSAYMKAYEGTDVEIQDPPVYNVKESDLVEVDYEETPKGSTSKTKKGRPRKYPGASNDAATARTSVAKSSETPRRRGRPPKAAAIDQTTDSRRTTRSQNSAVPDGTTENDRLLATGANDHSSGMDMESSALTAASSVTAESSLEQNNEPLRLAPIFNRPKRNIEQTERAEDIETASHPRKRRGGLDMIENEMETSSQSPDIMPSTESSVDIPMTAVSPVTEPLEDTNNPSAEKAVVSSQKRGMTEVEEPSSAATKAVTAGGNWSSVDNSPVSENEPPRKKRTKISDFFGRLPNQKQKEVQEDARSSDSAESNKHDPRDKAMDSPTAHHVLPLPDTAEQCAIVNESTERHNGDSQPMQLDKGSAASAEPPDTESAEPIEDVSADSAKKVSPEPRKVTSRRRRNQLDESTSGDGVPRMRSYKRNSRQNNIYLEQRKKIVLELLETKPIFERSFEFRQCYLAKKEELYGPDKNAHRMCMKTLWRTAEELANEGLVKLHEGAVANLNGTTSRRMLVLRKDLEIDGPEVTSYLNFLKERKVLYPMTFNISTYERVDNIEGLDERMERLKAEYALSVEQNQEAEAKVLEKKIKSLKYNMDMAEAAEGDILKNTRGNWMVIGLQFGFIPPKMIRVKLLHQYILGLLRGNVEGVDRENRTIASSVIISQMPFGLYLQIIGLFYPSPVARQYIKDPANLQVHIRDIPEDIRTMIFSEQHRFRRRLRGLLDTLCDIQVATRVSYTNSSVIGKIKERESASALALAYALNTRVPMYDYRKKDIPLVNEYDLLGATDVQIYWSDLQYLCTNIDNPDRHEYNLADVSEEYKPLIAILYNTRNWSTTYVFTNEQRKKLNSYVDKDTGKTPCKDLALCWNICEELQLSMTMVRGYFRKLEAAYERKMENRTLQKLERDLENRPRTRRRKKGLMADETGNMRITLSTTRAFKGRVQMTTAQKLARKQRTSVMDEVYENQLYMDDLQDVPLINEREIDTALVSNRLTRTKWTQQEDELLIYTNTILRSRGRKNRFLWTAAKKVLPARESNACRNRIGKLREDPKIAESMYKLGLSWERIYAQGIASGAIEDPDPFEVVDFDILGYLAYFIQQLQSEQSHGQADAVQIPANVEKLHQIFAVRSAPERIINCTIENQYHGKHALLQKHQVLCVNAFSLRLTDLEACDTPLPAILCETDPQYKTIELIKAFFKMILMTPQETYDPFYAYAILNRYPKNLFTRALDESKTNGVLVKARCKRLHDRRLPGMQYGISSRFVTRMAGQLPEKFLLQAKEYEKYLHDTKVTKFNVVNTSSGMMACMLDLISENKLAVCMRSRDLVVRKHLSAHSHSRNIDPKWMYFDMDVSLVEPRKDIVSTKSLQDFAPQYRTELLTQIQFDSALAGLLSIQDDCDRPTLSLIVDILTASGKDGLTLPELKARLGDSNIQRHLEMLLNNVPPLIAVVGLEAQRVVLTTDLENWLIVPKTVVIPRPPSQEVWERTSTLTKKRKTVVEPRIWVDVNGIVTESVLKGCLDVVIELLLQRPGITESAVCRHFNRVLTRVEVKDILSTLVQRGILRKLSTKIATTPTTLFSKPKMFETTSHDAIESTITTSYWLVPGFYNTST
ncbi:hypothetical protein EC973_009399 [Apophysomyces ossiformis]|uniref:Myb-like domain-containing protein n=1 Tax=Apophysomyces ossiformis TaxID=679940 RepID=A0A8H7EP75_9FUNG|nr:hypothetical protein EC973_009399 [Apophysomyces ossiformis]